MTERKMGPTIISRVRKASDSIVATAAGGLAVGALVTDSKEAAAVSIVMAGGVILKKYRDEIVKIRRGQKARHQSSIEDKS